MGMNETLERLADVTREIENLEKLRPVRDKLIVQARREGASWPLIADAAGISAQSVMNKVQRLKNKGAI